VCAAAILSWDRARRLRPLALGTPEAERLLADMPEHERWGSWHLVEPDGSVSSAGPGFVPLLARLPGGRAPAMVAGRFPAGAKRAYRLVADNRDRLGPLIPRELKRRADRALDTRTAR
jgi:hypothetical protein